MRQQKMVNTLEGVPVQLASSTGVQSFGGYNQKSLIKSIYIKFEVENRVKVIAKAKVQTLI